MSVMAEWFEIDFRLDEEEFGELAPELVRVACFLAPWPYVSYDALRKCRKVVAPRSPTCLESELCDSSIIASSMVDGVTFRDSFRQKALKMLRAACDDEASDFETKLRRLRSRLERRFSWLSPLLLIETEIAWAFVFERGDEFRKTVDDHLRNTLYTAVMEGRDGVFGWVAGARTRLPDECIQGEAGWLLWQLCQARQLEMAPVLLPSAVTAEGLIQLVCDQLPTLVVGLRRTAEHLEIGLPSVERAVGIVVVETDPLLLTLQELDQDPVRSPTHVRLKKGQTRKIACGSGEIVVGNLAGQTFTLTKMEGSTSVEDAMAREAIKKAELARSKGMKLGATVIRPVEAGYVVRLNDADATAFMFSPKCELFEGDELEVEVTRVVPEKRWISARPVSMPEAWDARNRASILHVPISAVPGRVAPGDAFPATIIKHGTVRGDRRSATSSSTQPRCSAAFHFSKRGLGHRPGHMRFPRAVVPDGSGWKPRVGARVEIVACGVIGNSWQLRLKPASKDVAEGERVAPIPFGARIKATIVAVDELGSVLEAADGERLWLPNHERQADRSRRRSHPLRVGQETEVRVLGVAEDRPDMFLVSRRAVGEPHLEHIQSGRTVLGTVDRRLGNGEYIIWIDPIRRIARRAFRARTWRCLEPGLERGMRISARVARIHRRRWMLLVSDVKPISGSQVGAE